MTTELNLSLSAQQGLPTENSTPSLQGQLLPQQIPTASVNQSPSASSDNPFSGQAMVAATPPVANPFDQFSVSAPATAPILSIQGFVQTPVSSVQRAVQSASAATMPHSFATVEAFEQAAAQVYNDSLSDLHRDLAKPATTSDKAIRYRKSYAAKVWFAPRMKGVPHPFLVEFYFHRTLYDLMSKPYRHGIYPNSISPDWRMALAPLIVYQLCRSTPVSDDLIDALLEHYPLDHDV